MSESLFETISYDQIFNRLCAEFSKRCPEYDAFLESDPAMKLLEVAAYEEVLLRTRIHEAIKANLLNYAQGEDLDRLAAFYAVERAPGESDEAFRLKIQSSIRAWSPAGSRDHYRFHALRADPRVKDARADSPVPGLVRIALLSHEDNGQASPELVKAVEAIVQSDSVRVLTDTVQVIPCTITEIAVKANIILYPEALPSVLSLAKTQLEEAFEKQKSLGWDVSRSWIIAHLFVEGVQKVDLESPLEDFVVGDEVCAALTKVELTLAGRQW